MGLKSAGSKGRSLVVKTAPRSAATKELQKVGNLAASMGSKTVGWTGGKLEVKMDTL